MGRRNDSEYPALSGLVEYSRDHGGKWSMGLVKNTLLEIPKIDKKIQGGNLESLFFIGELLGYAKEGSKEARWASRLLNRYSDKIDFDGNPEHLTIVLANIDKVGTDLSQRALDYINDNTELVELRSEGDMWLSRAYWRIRVEEAASEIINGEQNGINMSRLRSIWEKDATDRNEVVTNILFGYRSVERKSTNTQLVTLLVSMGFSRNMSSDLAKSWMTYRWESERNEAVIEDRFLRHCITNINAIMGISKEFGLDRVIKLYQDYGITHFGRYTVKMLTDQLINEDSKLPYGVAMAAYVDHNGALSNSNSIDKRIQLIESAKLLGYRTIFVEARSKVTVVRRVKWLARKYPDQKIAFKYIDAHGEISRFYLGEGRRDEDFLSVSDLRKESANKMKQYYTDSCPTLFDSCSTGLNIGPEYSKYNNGYSMAPDKPGYLRWVELLRDSSGDLFFDGAYGSDEESVGTVMSFNGEDAKDKVLKEKRLLAERNYQKMIHDPKFMDDLWSNRIGYGSMLLGSILNREILNPLYEAMLAKSYGKEIRFGIGVRNINNDELVISPDTRGGGSGYLKERRFEDDCIIFSPSFDEGFFSLVKHVYRHEAGRKNLKVFARIEVGGAVEEIPLNLEKLYPENIT